MFCCAVSDCVVVTISATVDVFVVSVVYDAHLMNSVAYSAAGLVVSFATSANLFY